MSAQPGRKRAAKPALAVEPLTPARWNDLVELFSRPGGSIARGCYCMAYRRTGRRELPPGLTHSEANKRELKALVDGGILETRREGTRAYFKADTRSPVFPELRGLIDKTAGLLPTLREALRPLDRRIACAFVYGSVARSDEHAASDVDLMVVGDAGLADITPALRKAEARLGREVNATTYSATEFRKKATAKDHFLSEVLRSHKLFVKGDQRDVDDLVGKPRRSTASDIEARAR